MSDEDGQMVDSQEMEDLSEEQSKLFNLASCFVSDVSKNASIGRGVMLAHFSLR